MSTAKPKPLLIDKYYQFVENDTNTVSIGWKICHILNLFLATLFSVITYFYFNKIHTSFGKNCVLFARLKFTSSAADSYKPIGLFEDVDLLHNSKTIWGEKWVCDLSSYIFLYIGIVGIILMFFFIIVSAGGSGRESDIYAKPWRIVLPAIIISVLCLCSALAGYFILARGLTVFCENFGSDNQHNCDMRINKYTLFFNKNIESTRINEVLSSGKLSLGFWGLFIVTLIVRIIRGIDFKVIVYQLSEIEKKRADESDSSDTTSENITESDVDELSLTQKKKRFIKTNLTKRLSK